MFLSTFNSSCCVFVSDSYTVRFYDGVVRTVKPTKVKPFPKVSFSCYSSTGFTAKVILIVKLFVEAEI